MDIRAVRRGLMGHGCNSTRTWNQLRGLSTTSKHPPPPIEKTSLKSARFVPYEGQKIVELHYKNHCVGEGYPDLVVRLGREKMVVELEAVGGEMGAAEEQQLRNYMKLLEVKQGLVINCQQPGKNPKENQT